MQRMIHTRASISPHSLSHPLASLSTDPFISVLMLASTFKGRPLTSAPFHSPAPTQSPYARALRINFWWEGHQNQSYQSWSSIQLSNPLALRSFVVISFVSSYVYNSDMIGFILQIQFYTNIFYSDEAKK